MQTNLQKILDIYRETSILEKVRTVLDWDMNVNLPPKAAEDRSAQSAYLTELVAKRWQNPEFLKMIRDLDPTVGDAKEKSIVRNLKHRAKFYSKIPQRLIIEKSKVASEAFMAWAEAKKNNDFAKFKPFLERIVQINKEETEDLGYKDNRYDALLDLYEPDLTASKLTNIFQILQPELTTLIAKIKSSPKFSDEVIKKVTAHQYPLAAQTAFCHHILEQMGYDMQSGRLDVSPHPFTITMGAHDIRITTHYIPNDFRYAITSSIHEGGHALYEQGINPEYDSTPLEGGVSLGIHESQSRFWENIVGRNDFYIESWMPEFSKQFPDVNDISVEEMVMAFNHVEPGFIRTEADEVTYNLHIMIRFEIEKALLNDEIKVADLPEAWQSKMKKYLGVEPKTDTEGCLQDVHWSYGEMGYFPTYMLGNLYASQFSNILQKKVDFGNSLKTGDLKPVRDWLKTEIHQYGSEIWPSELIMKVTGEELNPKYFLDYIKHKYSHVYDL